jgi:predicted regulator of Ras-like GTPase activity (Roadblock/LC7/MglB family)
MGKPEAAFDKILKKKLSEPNISRSKALTIILAELKKKGNFLSCVLTDNNGLLMAEDLHPQDNRDNFSASSALITDTTEKITDYLGVGSIGLSYFVSQTNMIWMKSIFLPDCGETFILFVVKENSLLVKLPKATLKLLGKEKIFVPLLLDIAAKYIRDFCDE